MTIRETLTCAFALLGFFAPVAMADIIKYEIEVVTADESGAGTDNFCNIQLHGDSKSSGKFDLDTASGERGTTESVSKTNEDIGVISKISLDLSGDLADDWKIYSIKVTRKVDDRPDGYSEFLINDYLGYDARSFKATKVVKPSVTISPTGEIREHDEELTLVNFGNNTHESAEQNVMKYVERWGSVDTVRVSTTDQTDVGASVTATYESPETVAGTFGAEASASWGKMLSETRDKEQQKLKESEFNWEYSLPPSTAAFRKVVFKVPYADQVYKSSDGTSRIVRKLNAEIVPIGDDEFLFIPNKEDGKVVPILWSEIETNWLPYMATSSAAKVKNQFKPTWLRRGWVVMSEADLDKAPAPIAAQKPAETAPAQTDPVATPATQPVATAQPATSGTAGVNGRNVVRVGFATGSFAQLGGGQWAEYGADGGQRFTFIEQARDDWSVYLKDPSRNMDIQLDLYRKWISWQNGGTKTDLYEITNSSSQ